MRSPHYPKGGHPIKPFPDTLLSESPAPIPARILWLAGALFGSLCLLFPARNILLGDGLLITDLIDKGVPFRFIDNLDYQAHRALAELTGWPAARVYRALSTAAGFLLIPLVGMLLNRLDWARWRRVVYLGLMLTTAPVLLFFGYVESYTWLYLTVTLFLVGGLAFLQRRLSLVWVSVLFGLALALHLTALFSFPALLALLLLPSATPLGHRLRDGLAPALLILAISLLVQVGLGYDGAWFARDFRSGAHALSPWHPNPLSANHLQGLGGLVLFMAPFPLLLVLLRVRHWFASPAHTFLAAQVLGLALLYLFLDPKLGLPRDWDLLAAHSGGLLLLATLLLPGNGWQSRAVVALGLLTAVPWVVTNHHPDGGRWWLLEASRDQRPAARAHLYADAALLLRRDGDMPGALEMYEGAVEADPHNPRHYQLRAAAAIAVARERQDDPTACDALLARAEADLRHYLEKRPDSPRIQDDLRQVLLLRRRLKSLEP